MGPFTKLRSPAMPMLGANIDTDRILPARFLPKPRSGGFGQYLFNDLRYAGDGSDNPDFVLNNPAYAGARIMVCEDNFGCGSSRENAVWAFYDYGFRVVIAPNFGEIFYNNALKNGLLPVLLPADVVAQLQQSLIGVPGSTVGVDLMQTEVTAPDGQTYAFEVDAFSKHCLLNGIDELDYTLGQLDKIEAFEREHLSQINLNGASF